MFSYVGRPTRSFSNRAILKSINFNPILPGIPSHLKDVAKKFTPNMLTYKNKSAFSEVINLYIYSNDAYRPGYLNELCQGLAELNTKLNHSDDDFEILSYLRKGQLNPDQVGIIIGNGNVLSLIPELPNNIFLLDVEPAVHYFILYVKNLILSTHHDDFESLKEILINKITQLENSMDNRAKEDIYTEIRILGDKHFLSSRERFEKCKEALKKKVILPIEMDIYDSSKVDSLALLLKNFTVTFLNVSNVVDYGDSKVLLDNIKKLPLNKNCLTVGTALTGPSENVKRHFIGDLDQLVLSFQTSEKCNGKRCG